MTPVFLRNFNTDNPLETIVGKFWNIELIPEDRRVARAMNFKDDAEEDIVWDGTDEEFQTLRDKYQKTLTDKTSEIFGTVPNILFAVYDKQSFSGHAFILYEHNGVLYEVNASHCSCRGLENQWDPEETTLDAIEHRITKGSLGREKSPNAEINCFDEEDWEEVRVSTNIFAEELLAFIQQYRSQQVH